MHACIMITLTSVSEWYRRKCKVDDEYGHVKNLPKESSKKQQVTNASNPYGHWQGK